MKLTNDYKDFEIIDSSNGMKLERWDKYFLLRPDPQIVWDNGDLEKDYKDKIHSVYYRSNKGGGHWENKKNLPESWQVHYRNLTFNIKLMGFKHTGLFPEQAYNWNLIIDKIKESKREVKVLNLFAYTGAASVAALSAGASVVHVDSSKGMIEWAKENVISSGLQDKPIRFLIDDVNGDIGKFEETLDIIEKSRGKYRIFAASSLSAADFVNRYGSRCASILNAVCSRIEFKGESLREIVDLNW